MYIMSWHLVSQFGLGGARAAVLQFNSNIIRGPDSSDNVPKIYCLVHNSL